MTLLLAGCAAAAGTATASGRQYGLVPTRGCLAQHGVSFGGATSSAAESLPLTAAEKTKVLVGLMTAKGASGPIFLYAVFGSSPTDAVAIRKQLELGTAVGPTPANSVAAQQGNAAWLIESLAGRPPASLSAVVASCLRVGSNVPKEGPLTTTAVSSCLAYQGAAIWDRGSITQAFPGLPLSVLEHLVAATVPPDHADLSRGVLALVLIDGPGTAKAIGLRSRLELVVLPRLDQSLGVSRNAAWVAIPTRTSTAAQVAAAKKTLLGCLR